MRSTRRDGGNERLETFEVVRSAPCAQRFQEEILWNNMNI